MAKRGRPKSTGDTANVRMLVDQADKVHELARLRTATTATVLAELVGDRLDAELAKARKAEFERLKAVLHGNGK